MSKCTHKGTNKRAKYQIYLEISERESLRWNIKGTDIPVCVQKMQNLLAYTLKKRLWYLSHFALPYTFWREAYADKTIIAFFQINGG